MRERVKGSSEENDLKRRKAKGGEQLWIGHDASKKLRKAETPEITTINNIKRKRGKRT